MTCSTATTMSEWNQRINTASWRVFQTARAQLAADKTLTALCASVAAASLHPAKTQLLTVMTVLFVAQEPAHSVQGNVAVTIQPPALS